MLLSGLTTALAVGLASCALVPIHPKALESLDESMAERPIEAAASGNACNEIRLNACQAKFNEDLKIKGTADFTNPQGLVNALLLVMEGQGPQGFIEICRARVDFANCLGSTYAACMDYRFYLAKGLPMATAVFYPSQFRSLLFQCTSGYTQILNNWKCELSTYLKSQNAYRTCMQNFAVNFPSQGCTAAVAYTNCLWAPYNVSCPRDLAWETCEATRVGFTTWLPYCNMYCSARNGAVIDTGISGEDGEATEKKQKPETIATLDAPPTVEKNDEDDPFHHELRGFNFLGSAAKMEEPKET